METATAQDTVFQVLLNDYVVYNAWANEQLVDWLRTKPIAKMDEEVPSSYPKGITDAPMTDFNFYLLRAK